MASRNLFGESVSVGEVLLALPKLYKTECLQWLTFRRLSPTRSFDMPLTVLELLKAKQRSARQSVLHRNHSTAATWLSIVAVHFESIIAIALVSLVILMIPETIEIDYFGILLEAEGMAVWAQGILCYVAMALVGPFYATSGFALYVSRRIDLEAWDVEIRFRHLAASVERKSVKGSKKILVSFLLSLVLITGFSLPSDSVRANPEKPSTLALDDSTAAEKNTKVVIINILKGSDFHRMEAVSGWRLKDFSSADEEKGNRIPDWLKALIEFFDSRDEGDNGYTSLIASVLKYTLWGGFIVVLLWLAYRYRETIGKYARSYSSKPGGLDEDVTTVMFGLDVRRESLPEDVPSEVRLLWEKGQHRESVGLLYGALLTGLIHQHGFVFSDGYTEGECVSIVESRGSSDLSLYTRRLTECWQNIAYGHVTPSESDVAELCSEWEAMFPNE